MKLSIRVWMIVAACAVVGCQSAEERCNAAKVEAYDAWEAVAVAHEAAARAVVEEPVTIDSEPEDDCDAPRTGESAGAFAARCETVAAAAGPCGDMPEVGESMDAYMLRCPDGEDTVAPVAPAAPAAVRQPPRESAHDALMRVRLEAELRRGGLTAAAATARRIRDLARGSALAYRDAANAELPHLADIDAPLLTRVRTATAAHWEQCSPVAP